MIPATQARQLTASECSVRLRSDLESGLSERDVAERRALYGDNELKPPEPTPLYMRYLAQFKEYTGLETFRDMFLKWICNCRVDFQLYFLYL